MSAVQASPLEPGRKPPLLLARMQVDELPEVMAIENDVYPYPWTHGNFLDSLYSDYEIWTARDASAALAGYFLLMLSVDEAHLLNIAVRRDMQGQGIGRLLLDHAAVIARKHAAKSILLEVRPTNERAVKIYGRYGFTCIGTRKGYYPAVGSHREDAIVMRLPL
jgi:ribosomal-protein-alanine N-acetyltransferase